MQLLSMQHELLAVEIDATCVANGSELETMRQRQRHVHPLEKDYFDWPNVAQFLVPAAGP